MPYISSYYCLHSSASKSRIFWGGLIVTSFPLVSATISFLWRPFLPPSLLVLRRGLQPAAITSAIIICTRVGAQGPIGLWVYYGLIGGALIPHSKGESSSRPCKRIEGRPCMCSAYSVCMYVRLYMARCSSHLGAVCWPGLVPAGPTPSEPTVCKNSFFPSCCCFCFCFPFIFLRLLWFAFSLQLLNLASTLSRQGGLSDQAVTRPHQPNLSSLTKKNTHTHTLHHSPLYCHPLLHG